MGSLVNDIGNGLGNIGTNLWNQFSGHNAQEALDSSKQNQSMVRQNSQNMIDQGAKSTGAASNFWNTWLEDPTKAYNATLGTAQNIGGANSGMATNNAVNAARGSGLNAGQAALAGGAQSANAFTQNTQNAQGNLMANQQASAQGQSNQGVAQQKGANEGLVGVAGQQAGQGLSQQASGDNMLGQVAGGVAKTFGL